MSEPDDKPPAATIKFISDFERKLPDIFDDADCRPGPSKMSEAYHDAVMPEHIKARIRAKRAKKLAASEMIFIENAGALFRGPSLSFPREVWSHRDLTWKPYAGAVPKPIGWGTAISQAEAWRLIAIDQGAPDFGTPPE
jgi:hypothetical protein